MIDEQPDEQPTTEELDPMLRVMFDRLRAEAIEAGRTSDVARLAAVVTLLIDSVEVNMKQGQNQHAALARITSILERVVKVAGKKFPH